MDGTVIIMIISSCISTFCGVMALFGMSDLRRNSYERGYRDCYKEMNRIMWKSSEKNSVDTNSGR